MDLDIGVSTSPFPLGGGVAALWVGRVHGGFGIISLCPVITLAGLDYVYCEYGLSFTFCGFRLAILGFRLLKRSLACSGSGSIVVATLATWSGVLSAVDLLFGRRSRTQV